MVGAGNHSPVHATFGEKFEQGYYKFGKVIHDILGGGEVSHVVGLATAGVHFKLLFMSNGAAYVSLLHTKSYIVTTFHTKEAFRKGEQILTDMLRLRVYISFIHCLHS